MEWENVIDVIQKRFSKTEVWIYIYRHTPCQGKEHQTSQHGDRTSHSYCSLRRERNRPRTRA